MPANGRWDLIRRLKVILHWFFLSILKRQYVTLKNNDHEAFSCLSTYSLGNASDKCLPLWTLVEFSLKCIVY